MCGIAGWNLTEKPSVEFTLTLAQAMVERGEDSYGFFSSETGIKKDIGPITKRIRASEMLTKAGFLHTRHATTGKVTADNAHPFVIGDVVFAHNGIVHSNWELNIRFSRNCSVDSMHIAYHMAEGKPLTDLEGYGAIQFYQDGAWYIGACNFGDLECAKLKNDKGIVWASTQAAIDSAVFQAGYEIEYFYKIEQGSVYRVEPDSLYSTDKTFQMTKRVYPLSSYTTKGKGSSYSDDEYWNRVWHGDLEKDKSQRYLPEEFRKGLDGGITAQSDDTGAELDNPEIEYGECEWCNQIGALDMEASDMLSADLCVTCAKQLV